METELAKQAAVHVIPVMWEWGALVGLLFACNLIQAMVIRTLYKRNILIGDLFLKHVQENTALTTEVRDAIRRYKR